VSAVVKLVRICRKSHFLRRSIKGNRNEKLKFEENEEKRGEMLLPKRGNSGKMQIGIE